MPEHLTATHVLDRHGQPLVVLEFLPGLYAERYPSELRALARLLITAANDADQGASGRRQYPEPGE